MSVYQIVFSPTGGTQKVADLLCSQWNTVNTIDLTDPAADFSAVTLQSEDIALVAVPSYGGRVPATATQRMKQIAGNGAKAILVCVYGNRAWEDTLTELQDTLEAAGFVCAAAVSAVAEHSILRQFAAGRPDAEDAAQLHDFAAKIRQKLESGNFSTPELEGAHGTYKEIGKGSMQPEGNSKCVSCGLCAKKCPVNAIDAAAPRKTDKDACIGCMRCVAICPQNARGLNPLLLKGAGLAMGKVLGGRKENFLYL